MKGVEQGNAAGPFTPEELQAFAALWEYVDCEREDYEGEPREGHIWKKIEQAKAAVARVAQEFEQKATKEVAV